MSDIKNYTPGMRADLHDGFKNIRKYVLAHYESTGISRGICLSIQDAWQLHDINLWQNNQCASVISKRLGQHLFYTTWIQAEYPELWEASTNLENDKFRGRLAWVDSLIEEFSE